MRGELGEPSTGRFIIYIALRVRHNYQILRGRQDAHLCRTSPTLQFPMQLDGNLMQKIRMFDARRKEMWKRLLVVSVFLCGLMLFLPKSGPQTSPPVANGIAENNRTVSVPPPLSAWQQDNHLLNFGSFTGLEGIAINNTGYVYAVDALASKIIHVFNATGASAGNGSFGDSSAFSQPYGIAING